MSSVSFDANSFVFILCLVVIISITTVIYIYIKYNRISNEYGRHPSLTFFVVLRTAHGSASVPAMFRHVSISISISISSSMPICCSCPSTWPIWPYHHHSSYSCYHSSYFCFSLPSIWIYFSPPSIWTFLSSTFRFSVVDDVPQEEEKAPPPTRRRLRLSRVLLRPG